MLSKLNDNLLLAAGALKEAQTLAHINHLTDIENLCSTSLDALHMAREKMKHKKPLTFREPECQENCSGTCCPTKLPSVERIREILNPVRGCE